MFRYLLVYGVLSGLSLLAVALFTAALRNTVAVWSGPGKDTLRFVPAVQPLEQRTHLRLLRRGQ